MHTDAGNGVTCGLRYSPRRTSSVIELEKLGGTALTAPRRLIAVGVFVFAAAYTKRI